MLSRSIALAMGALLASHEANAACVISGARPTATLQRWRTVRNSRSWLRAIARRFTVYGDGR